MMNETILVTGGAGYIGSHVFKYLSQAGYRVVVLDDLSNGHADFVSAEQLVVGSMGDAALLKELFSTHHFSAVCHLAASIVVGESTSKPGLYYRNNVANTITLLDAMVEAGVQHLVFASTCAIYGEPQIRPIPEHHPVNPLSPYGSTKLMVERILDDYRSAYGVQSVALRFFNAAGADPDGSIGEAHDPETHLIPLVIEAALGQRPFVSIFGTDYDTTDGTCIRDYVHVMDLAAAFKLSLDYMKQENASLRVNLGNMRGFSVKEVIETVQQVSQTQFEVKVAPRRPGDSPELVGSNAIAREILGWEPVYGDLETIVRHAWQWHTKQAQLTASIGTH